MKVRVLSLIVPALLALGSANAAEIYNKDGNKLDLFGKLDGLHYFSKDKGVDGDQSYLRPGLRGETQITDQLKGFGQWEYQFALNNAESEGTKRSFTRVGYAGLNFGDYGSIEYGRDYGVMYDVAAWTDALPEFGGDTYGVDNFLFQRGNGMLTYRNPDFFGLVDGLALGLQYQGKNGSGTETNNGRDVLYQNGDGYGMSLAYDIGYGIHAAAAYFNARRTADQNGSIWNLSNTILGNGKRAEAYSGGLKYDANNVYLATMYTQAYNAIQIGNRSSDIGGFANKAQNFEAVAQYQFDFGLRPSIAYLQSKGKAIEGYGSQDLLKYIEVGTSYFFNQNMSTYVDYKINLLNNNDFTRAAGINVDNIVALGLVYQF